MSELVEYQMSDIDLAEIDSQITTAKKYPRDVTKFIKNAITLATLDQETAESCIYALPRKGENGETKFIKGESIRLAEILLSCWGNMHAATRIVGNDGKKIKAQGAVWDLENNIKLCKEVERSIWSTRTKRTFSEDMQVVTGNAASSIALRNAILSVIPRAFAKKVYQEAMKAAIGDQTKIGQKIQALFDRFFKMGIDKEKILNYFGKKDLSEINVDDVEEMIGIGTAIKDGNLKIDDAFDLAIAKSASKASDLNNEMNGDIE